MDTENEQTNKRTNATCHTKLQSKNKKKTVKKGKKTKQKHKENQFQNFKSQIPNKKKIIIITTNQNAHFDMYNCLHLITSITEHATCRYNFFFVLKMGHTQSIDNLLHGGVAFVCFFFVFIVCYCSQGY